MGIVYSYCALFILQDIVNGCLKVIMTDILPLRIIEMDYECVFLHSDMDFQSDLVILFGEVSELMSLVQCFYVFDDCY